MILVLERVPYFCRFIGFHWFIIYSSLRTFLSLGAQGKISGGTQPPRDVDDSFSRLAGGFDEPQGSGWFHTFTVAVYKPYFDVDTADVLDRLKESLFPFRGTFTEKKIYQPRFIWTILDMHHSYIYSNIYWDFCDIYSTQKNGIIT